MTLGEPTESEKQVMQAKSYISDSFDYSHDFQNYDKIFRNIGEFDRSLTPKMGDSNDHLEQVRSFILKNIFQEPIIIISCDLESGNAYTTEGNHCLWVAHKEGIPSIPCCVIPH